MSERHRNGGGTERDTRASLRWVLSWLAGGIAGVLGPVAFAQGTVGTFPDVAFPPGNPSSPEKIQLGKALFFEEQLSSDNTMACATCHLPEAGGADPRAGAREPGADGVPFTADDDFGSPGMILQRVDGAYVPHAFFGHAPQATGRNAPTVIGAAFFRSLFWDLRASPQFRDLSGAVVLPDLAALETQAAAPPLSSVEMATLGADWDGITAKLERVKPLRLAARLPAALADFVAGSADYRPLFERAFGTPEVTRERVAMAIATYERTLVPDRTPFDTGTMTPLQELGFQLFTDPNRSICTICHHVQNKLFSDGFAHSIALPDHFRFVKTPTLRNVGLRRRLMHSGQFESLERAMTHYESVGFFNGPLTAGERAAMLAFLSEGLTDPRVASAEPPFDRPLLRSELAPLEANHFGQGSAGSAGVPAMIANAPPSVGNADFRVGVGGALAGSVAVLAVAREALVPGISVDGVPVHVDLQRARLVFLPVDGAGAATYRSPLPDRLALVGVRRFGQWFVLDPLAPGGFAASAAASFTVFAGDAPRGSSGHHGVPFSER